MIRNSGDCRSPDAKNGRLGRVLILEAHRVESLGNGFRVKIVSLICLVEKGVGFDI